MKASYSTQKITSVTTRGSRGLYLRQGRTNLGFTCLSTLSSLRSSVKTSKPIIKISGRADRESRYKWKHLQCLLGWRIEGMEQPDLHHPFRGWWSSTGNASVPSPHFQSQVFLPACLLLSQASSQIPAAAQHWATSIMCWIQSTGGGCFGLCQTSAHQNWMNHSHSFHRYHLIKQNPEGGQAFKIKIFTATSNGGPGHLYRHVNRTYIFHSLL